MYSTSIYLFTLYVYKLTISIFLYDSSSALASIRKATKVPQRVKVYVRTWVDQSIMLSSTLKSSCLRGSVSTVARRNLTGQAKSTVSAVRLLKSNGFSILSLN